MSKKRWYRVEVEFKVSGIVFVKEIDKIMAERAVKKDFGVVIDNYHTTNSDVEWEFPVHPEKKIKSIKLTDEMF